MINGLIVGVTAIIIVVSFYVFDRKVK